MHVDRHRVYVHAGVDPDLPLAAQDPDQLLWKIYKGADQRGHGARQSAFRAQEAHRSGGCDCPFLFPLVIG